MKTEFKKAGSILRHFMNDYVVEKADNYSTFFRGWKNIAGTDLASHSRVKDIYKNKVIVETDHPGWMQLLVMEKKNLLKKLKKNYPELNISDLRFILTDQDLHGDPPGENSAGPDFKPDLREANPAPLRNLRYPDKSKDKPADKLTENELTESAQEKKRQFEESLKKLGKSIAERQKKKE